MSATTRVHIPESAYMLGVAGMGMAPLAIFLAQAGCQVCGFDHALADDMRSLLESHGVEVVSEGEAAKARTLIYSSAFSSEHAIVNAARKGGADIMRRGEMLARVAEDFKLVAVVGSHGKTSTTGMLIHLLQAQGTDFNYILGARFRKDVLPPAHYNAASDLFIAEVDESDGTIEKFSPEVTVLVNLDWDHADQYATADATREAFLRMVKRTNGTLVAPSNCVSICQLEDGPETIGVETGDTDFLTDNGKLALAAARHLAADVSEASLQTFPGIARRQDCLLKDAGVSIWADYAHHPAEIEALLKLMRSRSNAPIIAVFQPHRYTRTAVFAKAFAHALGGVQQAFLLPVYAASEAPSEAGETSAIMAHAADNITAVDNSALFPALSKAMLKLPEVTVLFIGAGDIDQLANRFTQDWEQRGQLTEKVSPQTKLWLGEPMAKRTTIRVGGPAKFFAEPFSIADLQQLLSNANRHAIPTFFLGRGSNLIVCDQGFNGLVISLGADAFNEIEILDDSRVRVGAGVRLKELCGVSAKSGLGGFEFMEGIPGTVGGSLRMNAGAMGGWIFDVVEAVDFVSPDGTLRTLSKDEFHVGYRNCEELRHAIAVSAILHAGEADRSGEIRRRMDTYANKRKESQPREPSAGCIFKNPQGNFAGKLVDELGLKGSSIGGAAVSDIHGNFIINRGSATSGDIIALVNKVRTTVADERGVTLEPEVLLVGASWKEVLI